MSRTDPREAVALASRVLAAAGNADLVWGHVSVRDRDGRGLWIKAAGWGLDEVTPERVQLLDFDGALLQGDGPTHIESHIHAGLLRARPELGAVVHSHAPATVSFAALDVPMRAIAHESCLFVPGDIHRYRRSSALIASAELGADLAASIGDRDAALIPGHGMVAAGTDVQLAAMTAIFLDRACQVQLPVQAGGGPRLWTPDEEALRKRATVCSPAQLRAGWEYLARRARAG